MDLIKLDNRHSMHRKYNFEYALRYKNYSVEALTLIGKIRATFPETVFPRTTTWVSANKKSVYLIYIRSEQYLLMMQLAGLLD